MVKRITEQNLNEPARQENAAYREIIRKRAALPKLVELEERTANIWLALGTIVETSRGEENTYYRDEFENQFYCKNYPR
jgi:hypothetical protein